MIQVRIPAEPELSGEYEIMSNGKFYFPVLEDIDIGYVEADGKTIAAVEEDIRSRLNKYYADDSVTVDLIAVEIRPGQGISIFGMVSFPKVVKYEEGLKLLDILMSAGSFKEGANLHKVSLSRDNNITYMDISDLVQGRNFVSNIDMKEGDIIIVPNMIEYTNAQVTILGKVSKPGSYLLPDDTLVLEAVAAAGGPEGRAAVGKTIIIRMQDGEPKVIHIDLKALINKADLTQNLGVRDGDVIFVPETERFDVMRIVDHILDLNMLRRTINEDFLR